MLRGQIISAIQEIAGRNLDDIYFQQDRAPPHYSVNVHQYLDEIFPGRWIGRRDHIEWSAQSLDLNPLDYFLGKYLKNKVYITKPQNLDDLR